jgi:ATP-binding cassette subfamily F protein 3
VRERPNLLLLDEPTNHLDIEMREALAEALQDYDGALIVVAHDRHLLRATTDALWLVADGRVAPFDGDLDDYRDGVLGVRARADAGESPAVPGAPPTADRRAQRRAEAAARQKAYARRKPLADRIEEVEAALAELTREKKAVEEWLLLPDAYAEARRETLKQKIARGGDLSWQLARLEAEWLELTAALEDLDSG